MSLSSTRLPVPGKQWFAATHFYPLSNASVLKAIQERVIQHGASCHPGAAAKPAVVIVDLDGTAIDRDPRFLSILGEWLSTASGLKAPAAVRTSLAAIHLSNIRYSLAETFEAIGLDPRDPGVAPAFGDLQAFWDARFATNPYVVRDRGYPNAARYLQELHAAGATIVYLTGRDEAGMRAGTEQTLRDGGFPLGGERVQLMMKPGVEIPDAQFKTEAFAAIRARGTVVATFDNEPRNVMVFAQLFPKAMNVIVRTSCSDATAEPGRRLFCIDAWA